MQTVRLGQLVTSTAGRDRERYFVVVGVVDEHFVEVADGSMRLVGNPKRKNLRHVRIHRHVDTGLAEKLAQDRSKVTAAPGKEDSKMRRREFPRVIP
jgi:large subunit ribosomal protein L14e